MPFGITKKWLATKKAYNTLVLASCGAVILVLLNITDIYLDPEIVQQINDSRVLSIIDAIVVVPIIFGTIYLCVAMWVYWAKVDDSAPDTKTIWFFLMIFGVYFAAIVYYFVIYRRQVLKRLRHYETEAVFKS